MVKSTQFDFMISILIKFPGGGAWISTSDLSPLKADDNLNFLEIQVKHDLK